VVKDAAKKKKISDIYARSAQIVAGMYANRPRPPHMDEKQYQTLMKSATYLFEHMYEAPVLLFAGLRIDGTAPMQNLPPEIAGKMGTMARSSGSSIYPAVQNIILACRAFGIGTVLTTVHLFFEDEVKEILGLPREVQTYALLPMGYPINKFGPVKRRPVREVAYLDSYGNNWKG